MINFESDTHQLVSAKSSTETTYNFVPMTGPIPSHRVTEATFSVRLDSAQVKVQPAIQYSNDGQTWDAGVPIDASNSGLWKSTAGWHYYAAQACPGDFNQSASPPTERRYCRFGLAVVNVSGSLTGGGSAKIRVQLTPVPSGTLASSPMVTATGGSASTVFTPLTTAADAKMIQKVRFTWRMDANSGDATTEPAWQFSDDGVTWGSDDDSGADPRDANGISYGTGFVTFDNTPGNFVRFGILAVNGDTVSNGDIEACQSTLIVDWRG